jgi:hypothetical protein
MCGISALTWINDALLNNGCDRRTGQPVNASQFHAGFNECLDRTIARPIQTSDLLLFVPVGRPIRSG